MEPIGSAKPMQITCHTLMKRIKASTKEDGKGDILEISNTSKAFSKIDRFLDLGKPDRLNIDDLNTSEKEEFMKMLSELLKEGFIGYEILEVNGKPEKHYVVNQTGDHRLRGTRLYKKHIHKIP